MPSTRCPRPSGKRSPARGATSGSAGCGCSATCWWGRSVWANTLFYASFPAEVWRVARPVLVAVGVAWLVVQFYALPYLVIQERKNLLVAWKNGLLTALSAPVYTLVVAGLGLGVGLISLILVAPLALGGPAFVAVLANEAVLERLKTYKLLEE